MPRRIGAGGPFLVPALPLGSDPNNIGPSGGRGMVLRFLDPFRVKPPLWFEEELPIAAAVTIVDEDAFLPPLPGAFPKPQAALIERAEEWIAFLNVDDDQQFVSGYAGYPQVKPFVGDDDAWIASIPVDDEGRILPGGSFPLPLPALIDRADDWTGAIPVDDDQRFDSGFRGYAQVKAYVGDDDAWIASLGVDDDSGPTSVPNPSPTIGRLIFFDDDSLPVQAAVSVLEDGDGWLLSPGYISLRPGSAIFGEDFAPSLSVDDDAWSIRPAPLAAWVRALQFDEDNLPALPLEEDGWRVGVCAGQLALYRLPIFEDESFVAVLLGVLLVDPRFIAADYARPLAADSLARRFSSGDYARASAADNLARLFDANDFARLFTAPDLSPAHLEGVRVSFDIKYVPEIVTLTFPFTAELNGATITPASPVITPTTVVGTDGNPSNLLNGAAQISAGLVLQSVKAGLDGCSYHFVCQVDLSDGRRLNRIGTLRVQAP